MEGGSEQINYKISKAKKSIILYMGRVDAYLAFSGESLNYVDSTEISGMTFDSKWQWGPHNRVLAGKRLTL